MANLPNRAKRRLATEAYEKALEYLQQMKEYLDLAGGASEEPQPEEQDLNIEEDN